MNRGLVLALALAAVLAFSLARPQDTYTTKYDDVDVDGILGNPRLRDNYMKCLLGDTEAGCTPEGKELRTVIPDALKTQCSKCNDKQKATVKRVINKLRKGFPEDWEKLRTKWDPQNEYYPKYASKLDE